MSAQSVNPEELAPAVGFSHGILAGGTVLALAGQIGCDPSGRVVSDDLMEQTDRALENLVAVVRNAGGRATDVIKLVMYVTDIDAYREARSQLGPVWRRHFGRYYPAITLVAVTDLYEARAQIEIDGLAVLPATQAPDVGAAARAGASGPSAVSPAEPDDVDLAGSPAAEPPAGGESDE